MKNTNKIKISCTFSVYLLLTGMVWPTYEADSWQLKTSGYEISKVKYSIFGKGLKEHQGYYFPEYAPTDQALYVGFKPIRFQRVSVLAEAIGAENKKIHSWKTEFEPPIGCLDRVTFLYHRIYVRNVSEYIVYIQSSRTEKWYRKKVKIPFKGYQIPSYDAISQWEQLINDSTREESWFLNAINNFDRINQLVIVVNPTDMDFDFVIGDLQIVDREIGHRAFHHPFFDSILNADSAQHIEKGSFYNALGIPALLLPISWYAMHGNYGPIFHFDPGNREVDARDIRELKVKVIKRILELYPFYEEQGLNRKSILDRFASIENYGLEREAFEDSVSALFAGFQDAHLAVPKKKQSRCAFSHSLALYSIGGRVYVAAVFDSLLTDEIEEGMEVLEFNGGPVIEAIDKQSEHYRGSRKIRKRKAVRNLLACRRDERVKLKVSSVYGVVRDVLIEDRKVQIPSNLVPRHGEFRVDENGIAYFRIRQWTYDVWIRFLNHADDLESAKGLIIDLRSNGGGDGGTVLRMVSAFIDENTLCGNDYCPADGRIESLVIRPNDQFHFDLPVVILANEATACASENFIDIMRYTNRAIMVADGHTQGLFSHRIDLIFPDGMRVYMNSLSKPLSPNGSSYEVEGLAPDIWIHLNTIDDLAHRDDKMLRTAKYLLGAQ